MLKKIISVLFIMSLTVCCATSAKCDEDDIFNREIYLEEMQETPEYWETAANVTLELSSKSALLMEASTGTVLYENNPDEKLPLASVTKIMTTLLVMEAIDAGSLTLDDTAVCSEHAATMGGSQIWLEPGEEMTVDDLLKAMLIGSANDATCVLAEKIGGSEAAFIAMMNDRATELGMENSCFVNTNGLPAEGHYSSARDIAIMTRELLKHDLVFEYTTVWMDTLRGGETQLVNTNKLIRHYEGATGLKTGYTVEAGYCISATASRNDLELIAVTLGAPSKSERFDDAKQLLDFGFINYTCVTPEMPKEYLPYDVEGGECENVNITAAEPEKLLILKGTEDKISVEMPEPKSLQAPVCKGDTVGEITVKYNGETALTVPIYATEDVAKLTFGICFKRMLEYLLTF